MFEIAKLLGTPERRIVVQTGKGSDVPNSIAAEPNHRLVQLHAELLRRHAGRWVERSPARGRYNCFGHLWASRRTAIYDEPAVCRILEDDGYRRLGSMAAAAPADIVLYHGCGGLLHAGQILELRDGSLLSPVPWVLSKWNDGLGEVLHHWREVPFQDLLDRVEFWTDRP